MRTLRRGLWPAVLLPSALVSSLLAGCASPGPPRAPSLQLPAPVTDLSAARRGDAVELHFTLPRTTSDRLPLRSPTVMATICRALEQGPCAALPGSHVYPAATTLTADIVDALPSALASGPPRLLIYRVQLANERGRSADYSEPAYAAAGAPPRPVEGLHAQGSRLGVVVAWKPVDGHDDVVLRREDRNAAPKLLRADSPDVLTAPVKATKQGSPGAGLNAGKRASVGEAGLVWLNGGHQSDHSDHSGNDSPSATLDTTALLDEPYRYTAERRRQVKLGGRTLELRSSVSPPVEFTLQDVYPPPAPTNLSAAGFVEENGGYSVDLIWQPVDDAALQGYNVYRRALGSGADGADGEKMRLTALPVALPAFHDRDAVRVQRYRYSVTSVDAKGNESAGVDVVVEGQQE